MKLHVTHFLLPIMYFNPSSIQIFSSALCIETLSVHVISSKVKPINVSVQNTASCSIAEGNLGLST
jgi:hypothetical protein